MKLKLAASPAPAYKAPSGPNSMVPMEWLMYCWHQSLISTVSWASPPMGGTDRRDKRALATQPFRVGPGGLGQASLHTGAIPPMGAS